MDYEKEYKKLKAGISNAYLYAQTDSTKAVLESILPELKESEDEKMRAGIIKYLSWIKDKDGSYMPNNIPFDDMIDWLEKQGKSSDQIHYWTEEEIEPIISDYLRGAEHYGGMIGRLRCLKPKSLEKQGEQKPAWSEEDERIRQCLIQDQEKALDDVRNDKYGHSEIVSDLKEMYCERIDWLESIKNHCTPQWKPSEEQIDAIKVAIAYMTDESETPTTPKVLSELLEQLKNL